MLKQSMCVLCALGFLSVSSGLVSARNKTKVGTMVSPSQVRPGASEYRKMRSVGEVRKKGVVVLKKKRNEEDVKDDIEVRQDMERR